MTSAGVIASPPKEAGRPKAKQRARAWLGIKHQVITPELAETLKLDVDVGVRILELYEQQGEGDVPYNPSPEFDRLAEALHRLGEQIDGAPANVLIKDVK